MIRPRLIPCLLLEAHRLVKTVRFKNPRYVGDPVNAVRIFNSKEVDEIILLDIGAGRVGRGPDFLHLADIASECFMPLCYGGGVSRVSELEALFKLGVEKVAINTAAVTNPGLVGAAAREFGSQSIVVSIDVKLDLLRRHRVRTRGGRHHTGLDAVSHARQMEEAGCGEILLTSVDRDGVRSGYDLAITRAVADAVRVPVIACGGAGSIEDVAEVVNTGGAAAAAAGSMFVFQGPRQAVLISYPTLP